MEDPALLSMDDWPEEIAFVPYVGKRYLGGFEGRRVLLLGESHYRSEGIDNDPLITRPFTRRTFDDMQTCTREGGGKFFNELDRLLTNQTDPSLPLAADAWQQVAFCNLSQRFAGTASGHRPSSDDFREGSDVLLKYILPILRPDVILVLGRTAWRRFNHGKLADHPVFLAPRANSAERRRRYLEERELWTLEYGHGVAWMTWVYHPSWSIDRWEDRAAALRYLLDCPHQTQDA
ncbi:uracil-DNA glycosylase family protein [Stenotrophomonas sp.]|uniref:uracil-DNA glycosylase family protein n=1 Tax=Stenotrophomonas sp. TaxID=69392 RepID=UPI002D632789|nr:uracil-DNA glycosylase family protein [Stenotrophomonas sp.]HYQ24392.1 uracil-DNA glycosylase family protein [Stenotrophomonas sp.]